MKDLDLTLEFQERARFKYIYGTAVEQIESAFSQTKLLCLAMVYHKFVLLNGRNAKYMKQEQLGKFITMMFHVIDVNVNQRIVEVISNDTDCTDPEFRQSRGCTLQSFIKMFNIYFSDDLEKRMAFVFSVYDRNNVGYLDREVVMRFVENFFDGEDEDVVQVMCSDMRELIFSKFDLDKDMQITFEEYSHVVRKQPLLMEFLGKVFPSEEELRVVAMCVNLLPSKMN